MSLSVAGQCLPCAVLWFAFSLPSACISCSLPLLFSSLIVWLSLAAPSLFHLDARSFAVALLGWWRGERLWHKERSQANSKTRNGRGNKRKKKRKDRRQRTDWRGGGMEMEKASADSRQCNCRQRLGRQAVQTHNTTNTGSRPPSETRHAPFPLSTFR